MKRFIVLLALCGIFGWFSEAAFGQGSAAVLEGVVADASGAVLAETSVELRNQETGGKLSARTNGEGFYLFASVQPGIYSLKVEHAGFEGYQLSGLRITAAQRATQNVKMQLGATTTNVTVDAQTSALLIEPTSNEVGTLIESESVAKLPLNGRDFLQLGLLSGAAQSSGTTVSDFLTLQVGHPDRTIVINGNEQDMTGFFINGLSIAGSRLGQASLNLSVAAIDQFKIHEGFFLPSDGPVSAGTVTVVTRGGTNRIHGEAFEFVRNNVLDARNYFDAKSAAPFHRNQFGGAVGGPLLKDKLFYFGHYEGRRQMLLSTVKATIPSEAMFGGDFSELLEQSTPIQLYNPYEYDATTGTRKAFSGNKITTSLNPMALKLAKYYRSATTYSTQNLTGNPRTTDNYDQYGTREDWTISPHHSLFAQYVHENSPTIDGSLFQLSGYGFPLTTDFVVLQLTSTHSSSLVNEFRTGWLRPAVFSAGDTQPGIQTTLGFTGTADVNGLPGIFLSGFSTSGAGSNNPSFGRNQGLIGNIDNQYQAHDSLSWLKGHHELGFGFDANYVRTVQESSNFYSRGGVWFSATYTAQLAKDASGNLAPVSGTGNSFADFLLGMPLNGSVTSMPRTHFRWTAATPYIQDTWHLAEGLTLNLGLGWNMTTPPRAVGSDSAYPHAVDLKTGQVKYAALGDTTDQVYKMDWNNLAPRIGFSYQPHGMTKLLVKAGAGVYYPSVNALYELFAITAPGVAIVQSFANSTSAQMPTYTLGNNVFPAITATKITRTYADNVKGTVFALDPNLRTTYVPQWTAAVQYELAHNLLAEVDYIGSQGRKLPIRWNADDCSRVGSYECKTANKPFPQFTYIYAYGNEGSASYNALVAKLQRQFASGWNLTANYTWSKALANTEQGGAPVGLNQRGTCLSCDKGMTGFNAPQRFVISSLWQLPVGRGHHYLADASPIVDRLAGGWSLNMIATFAQGNPFTVLAANSTSMDPMTNFRPNRVCEGRKSLTNKSIRTNGGYWIDTACFAAPETGYFGNSGTNIITGPGINNWDLGLGKEMALVAGSRIEMRAEAFNAANHAQFNNPDATMTDATFGKITTAAAARQLQFVMKVLW